MIINDRVYGKVEVNEPVLIELINSNPVQRLKRIHQDGPVHYAMPGKNITRYEHSVGVMLLLKKFGAGIEEQIAGLLHDVPHTAFSHVADFVFANEKHEFHEKFHNKIITESEIPDILEKHGIKADTVINGKHDFGLLEKELPDLCADRIDYTLRDMTAYFGLGKKAQKHIENLQIFGITSKEFISSSEQAAFALAIDYMKMDRLVWSEPKEISLYRITAEAIKIALDAKELSLNDLFTDDDTVLKKLQNSGNDGVRKLVSLIGPMFSIKYVEEGHDFIARSKIRYIDPKFSRNGKLVRLSEENFIFKGLLEEHVDRSRKGHKIKVEGLENPFRTTD